MSSLLAATAILVLIQAFRSPKLFVIVFSTHSWLNSQLVAPRDTEDCPFRHHRAGGCDVCLACHEDLSSIPKNCQERKNKRGRGGDRQRKGREILEREGKRKEKMEGRKGMFP